MVEMLRDSPVGMFSPTALRVGTAVNLFNEQCVVRVQRMVQAYLPIYIIWGHCNRQGRQSFKNLPARYLLGKWVRENCYPSDKDIVQAIALADAAEQTRSVRGPVPQRPLPVPPRGSHQKKGENWQDFLACQEISNKEKEVHETPNETAARSERSHWLSTREERGDGLSVGAGRRLSTSHQHRALNSKRNLGIVPGRSEALRFFHG